jgi:hypothetical protein
MPWLNYVELSTLLLLPTDHIQAKVDVTDLADKTQSNEV